MGKWVRMGQNFNNELIRRIKEALLCHFNRSKKFYKKYLNCFPSTVSMKDLRPENLEFTHFLWGNVPIFYGKILSESV
jgi:hypothetical protein